MLHDIKLRPKCKIKIKKSLHKTSSGLKITKMKKTHFDSMLRKQVCCKAMYDFAAMYKFKMVTLATYFFKKKK